MTVSGTNLSMVRGDTEFITVAIRGYTLSAGDVVTLTVREDVESGIALQKKVSTFSNNAASITIEHDDTAGLDFGQYVYDIQLDTKDGMVRTLVKKSKLTIEEEVTY